MDYAGSRQKTSARVSRGSLASENGWLADRPAVQWVNTHVQDQPVTSILTIFGVGFVCGVGLIAATCSSSRQHSQMLPDSLTDRISEALSSSMKSLESGVSSAISKARGNWA